MTDSVVPYLWYFGALFTFGYLTTQDLKHLSRWATLGLVVSVMIVWPFVLGVMIGEVANERTKG